jgi:fructose-bisphosphate aldolase, class I
MAAPELELTARALVAPGKGILAADESDSTIKKRFDSIDVESTEENRRAYRDLLFTTEGMEEYISGVILFDETLRQQAVDGTPFPQLLSSKGVIPGIKVDLGAKPLANAPGETITEGLDGLRERLQEYRGLGARFAKWRATYSIGPDKPSDYCIWTNAHALGRYAALCQEQGLVPIVEPEVLMDGDHDIHASYRVTSKVLFAVFTELHDQRVELEGILLKPNMVLSGYECPEQASDDEVAELTIRCFRERVPAAVPGIVFLSGGQSDEEATRRLNAMNARGPHPWQLSFSYGRALQAPSLKAWLGKPENVPEAQKAFYRRAKFNSAARSGTYAPEMETAEVG